MKPKLDALYTGCKCQRQSHKEQKHNTLHEVVAFDTKTGGFRYPNWLQLVAQGQDSKRAALPVARLRVWKRLPRCMCIFLSAAGDRPLVANSM